MGWRRVYDATLIRRIHALREKPSTHRYRGNFRGHPRKLELRRLKGKSPSRSPSFSSGVELSDSLGRANVDYAIGPVALRKSNMAERYLP